MKRINSIHVALVLTLLTLVTHQAAATILTFEDFTAANFHVHSIANPFGAGQYGSRASSPINAGFQQGDGWTPNVVLSWSQGWQTYVGWPFGNNAQTSPGGVAQADFAEAGGNPLTLIFTPDSGFGVLLKSFAFTVWDGSPQLPVQIEWAVFKGSVSPENQIAGGTSAAIGASGGAQTIITGLINVQSSGRPVILRWQLVSGDPTYLAINNVHYVQGAAKEAPVLAWTKPDAIVAGTALSGTQLNATANVPGTFVYTPAAGTVLPVGTHTLTANFTPTDTATYENGQITTTILVKANNVPVITIHPPRRIGTNDPLTLAMFNATSDVRGTFTLSPPAGTLLPVGTHTVTLTFTPESAAFVTVVTNVSIIVIPVVPEGTIWIFDDPANRLLAWSGDDELTFYDPNSTGWPAAKIAFGSASSFGLPLPSGGNPQVMRFSHTLPTEGLKLDFNDPPNGVFAANGWVANYTLVFDVLYPASSSGTLRPLYNSNLQNANQAEAFVSAATPAAVQVLGRSFGEIRANTWHRVTLVVRSAPAEGQIHIYVDGTFIGAIGSNDGLINSRYALEDFLFLLTDNAGNGGAGYLSGLRFVGRNLDYFEVKALGGVNAGGPHVAGPAAPRPPFQPLRDVIIIGHRGNGGFAPEDTLPSFVSSFELGGDVVEIDIRRTADNRVVAMHDSTVDRTTDGTGSVSSKTLAELQTLDAGFWFSPLFAGTPPPALRDVMVAVKDAYPNGILYLDCKVNGLAPLIKADCDATGFSPDRLWIWIYDQPAEAAAFRAIFPNAKIIWGEGNWAHSASIFEWPSLNAAQRRLVVNGMKDRGVYGFDFGDNEADNLNPATIQELRAAGFFVSLYSTLHPASMTRAINDIGIDGMETDFPGVLRELMPRYTSLTTASAASSSSILVTWTEFHPGPQPHDVQLRGKPKASPTWTVLATGLSKDGGSVLVTGLEGETTYEFQVLGYGPQGQFFAAGSVAEAATPDTHSNNGQGN
jgi:glycerophosphoryl diester phosphodiesterase